MSETVSYKDSSAYWRGYHEGFQAGLMEEIKELFSSLSSQINKLDAKLDNLDNKYEIRINQLEQKFESKIDRLEQKQDKLSEKIEELFMKLQNQNLPSICLEVKGDPKKVREVLKDVLQNTNQYTYLLKF